jgi:hypothetical protein
MGAATCETAAPNALNQRAPARTSAVPILVIRTLLKAPIAPQVPRIAEEIARITKRIAALRVKQEEAMMHWTAGVSPARKVQRAD